MEEEEEEEEEEEGVGGAEGAGGVGEAERAGGVGGAEHAGGFPRAPGYDPEVRKNCKLNGHDLRPFPERIGGRRPLKPCRWCMVTRKVRRETRFYCKECSYQPLCVPCFFEYHKPDFS